MLEARITKAIVVQDAVDQGTVLMGVAEYYGDAINFKVKFDWETLDYQGFLQDLRETLAVGFDIPPHYVDVQGHKLLEKMKEWSDTFVREKSNLILPVNGKFH